MEPPSTPGPGAPLLPALGALALAATALSLGARPVLAIGMAALASVGLELWWKWWRTRRANRQASEGTESTETGHDELSEAIDALETGLLLISATGETRRTNPAFRRLVGLEGEALGRPAAELYAHPGWPDLITSLLAGKGIVQELSPKPGAEGAREPRHQSLLLRGQALEAGGALLLIRDGSSAKRMAERSRDLVANVSHELKTPLTAIRGAAETLEDGALDEPEAARRFLSLILEQCERLEALLGDLLTLSHLEGAAAEPQARPVDMAALAREAIELLRPMAGQRDVHLHLETSGEAETLWIPGHANALERMLLNLLENAIKYNRPGGKAHLLLEGSEQGLRILLQDTGIGIPQSALERIFERFYRVDKGRSRDQGGTGLGLAIVKHVARSHRGALEVASELGQGSSFTIRLPRPQPEMTPVADEATTE